MIKTCVFNGSNGWLVQVSNLDSTKDETISLADAFRECYSSRLVLGPFATRKTARKIQREMKKVLYCAEELENR